MGSIVINGMKHDVIGPTRIWTETGMEFKAGKGARWRANDIDLVVWHYTGGEGDAARLFRVLDRRKLGVEFFIDRAGVIWQFCDPMRIDTFDAGIANRRSVGVEIACYGHVSKDRKVPKKGKDRKTYSAKMHGVEMIFAHFYRCQIAAAVSLADALSSALDISFRVPVDETDRLITRELSEEEFEAFSGHIGHYHVSKRKVDPGPALLNTFRVLNANKV